MIDSTRRRFVDKAIVVTGAAQGIGGAVARLLVAEGAFVYALDRNRDRLAQLVAETSRAHPGAGVQMEAIAVDIGERTDVERAVERVDRQRTIDGLVNAAGVLVSSPFEATKAEGWLDTFSVNVHGTFFVSQSVARRMIGRRAGAIVTVASNAGGTPRVNMSAYCASKAAAAMLTKCMGLELGRHGIRCNVVSPGSTDTAMLNVPADDREGRSRLIDGDLKTYRTGIPLGRIAEPHDVAAAVAFLLSEDAKHVTMHDLVVDGGATL